MESKKHQELKSVSSTEQELLFIRHLGEWANLHVGPPRLVLLQKYREAVKLRKKWDGIRKKEVISYLDGEIKKDGNKHTGRYCADCNTPHDGWCCPKCGSCL